MTTCQRKLNRVLSTFFRAHLKILVLRARKHEGLPWLAEQKPCHKPFLIWSTMYFNFPKYSAEILAKRGLAPFSWQVNEMQSSFPASGEGESRFSSGALPCTATWRLRGKLHPLCARSPSLPPHTQQWLTSGLTLGVLPEWFLLLGELRRGREERRLMLNIDMFLGMWLAEASWMWIQANQHRMYRLWNASTGVSQSHLSRLCCAIC